MMKMGKKMSPAEAKAKLSTLKELMKDMDDMMMEDMKNAKGMAKVSVASDSPEGLKKGLEKAEEMVEGDGKKSDVLLPKFGSKQEAGAEMDEDSFEEDSEMDEEDDSEESLDKKIAELLAKKKAKSQKQI
jgi:hypothetical protein